MFLAFSSCSAFSVERALRFSLRRAIASCGDSAVEIPPDPPLPKISSVATVGFTARDLLRFDIVQGYSWRT